MSLSTPKKRSESHPTQVLRSAEAHPLSMWQVTISALGAVLAASLGLGRAEEPTDGGAVLAADVASEAGLPGEVKAWSPGRLEARSLRGFRGSMGRWHPRGCLAGCVLCKRGQDGQNAGPASGMIYHALRVSEASGLSTFPSCVRFLLLTSCACCLSLRSSPSD